MLSNPYTPGAGLKPGFLAGRDEVLQEATGYIASLAQGRPNRSVIYYGLRGVGKTVLLNKLEEISEERAVLYEHLEISERSSFKATIALTVHKLMQQLSSTEQAKNFLHKTFAVLKAFQITYSPDGEIGFGLKDEINAAVGVADTGNFQNDLTELLVALGTLAQKNSRAVCLFIDEIQYLKGDELEALVAALHRCNQKGLPLALFGAGLPKIVKMAGDIKSYAERLFQFVAIAALTDEEARAALREPAQAQGVQYDDAALARIIEITEGYPYFLQEYGKQIWPFVDKKTISAAAVAAAYPRFETTIDAGFFKVRFDRATPKEQLFLLAMAECDNSPCTMAQLAQKMNSSVQQLSPLRNQLIHKGFICSTGYGTVQFSVPQFSEYLRRTRAEH